METREQKIRRYLSEIAVTVGEYYQREKKPPNSGLIRSRYQTKFGRRGVSIASYWGDIPGVKVVVPELWKSKLPKPIYLWPEEEFLKLSEEDREAVLKLGHLRL